MVAPAWRATASGPRTTKFLRGAAGAALPATCGSDEVNCADALAGDPLSATTRHSPARISATGAHRKRSQLLCEAKFMSAARRFTPNRIHVPHRAEAGGSGETWNPARPRMIKAASTQIPTATALAMRSLAVRRALIPPQAARPRGAPNARAAWKAAMARKPAAAATASVIGVLISAFPARLAHLTSRRRAHAMTRLHNRTSTEHPRAPGQTARRPAGAGGARG